VKKKLVPATLAVAVAIALALGSFAIKLKADDDDHDHDSDRDRDHSEFRGFAPGTIVLSRTVYKGTADTVTIGESLPPGCQPATVQGVPPAAPVSASATVNVPVLAADQPPTTTPVSVSCGYASDNGEAPNLNDSHNVWNKSATDGSFGVSSPIFLDDLTTDGHQIGTLPIPSNEIVTSFSSKSELALNRSVNGKSLTFMGYRGGPGCPTLTLSGSGKTLTLTQGTNVGPISPTRPNLIDASASSTPGLCDPTNTAVASYVGATGPTAYYRAVAEVSPWGHVSYTDNNAYSGDNSRAVIKADNSQYYSVGNDNSGNLSKTQVGQTQLGVDLSHSTGAELIVPGQTPLVPPNNNMLGFFVIGKDKPGKDTNFRGLTIFNDTVFVTKGSGGNGVNTVYQVGTPGTLPTPSNAPKGATINEPITSLPGFPALSPPATSTTAGTASAGGYYPFGIWFANATTLYVCNEGDLSYTPNQVINGQVNVANPGDLAPGTLFSAGLQKWVLQDGTWVLQYVIQNGLDIGVPYSVPNYPASIEPATGGCRNMIGVVNHNGTATIYAITSTISKNGDNGADPDKLVKVTDVISATQLATGDGDHDKDDRYDHFVTLRTARAGEAFRGVALAPEEDNDRDHDREDHDR
jgi:hypothetical protein